MTSYVVKKGKAYWPNSAMKKMAVLSDPTIYDRAGKSPMAFWAKLAKEGIEWKTPWKKVYEEKAPFYKWFVGGKLNVAVNCLDRHVAAGRGDDVALISVLEPTNEKPVTLTYKELLEKVNQCANFYKSKGVKKGDVVSIYMPLISETAIAMLACARIGAIHSVVFSAFSPDALKQRIQDAKAKILVTADGYYRRGKAMDLLSGAKNAAQGTTVKTILVAERLGKQKASGKLVPWSKVLEQKTACAPTYVETNDPLFILYTSGTTGAPKGVVHDSGGYLTQAYWTTKWNFDLKAGDTMWCTADVGWVTGHTYAVYGPMALGVTTLLFEGSPDFPDLGRWWQIVQDHKVNVLYTAPTAIRMFMKMGEQFVKKYDLSSLEVLGTVGEPIDEKAWTWYFQKIGGSRCPIVDTWWQTETGGNMINSLPGIGPFIPSVAGRPFPGVRMKIVDDSGKEIKKAGQEGNLVMASPFAPGLLRTVWGNKKKYKEKYFDRFGVKLYDSSDGAYFDKEGYIRITGRVDDVMKVAGHRLATAEVEDALDSYAGVGESAVVPLADEVKGHVPVAFVVLSKGVGSPELEQALRKQVDKKIGPTARPAKVYFVPDLPKTRSGKIMRRILKNVLHNEEPQGLQTLVNPDVVPEIISVVKAGQKKK